MGRASQEAPVTALEPLLSAEPTVGIFFRLAFTRERFKPLAFLMPWGDEGCLLLLPTFPLSLMALRVQCFGGGHHARDLLETWGCPDSSAVIQVLVSFVVTRTQAFSSLPFLF